MINSYKEACQIAKEVDKNLTAYDFNSDDLVVVQHIEGTQLMYRCAFLKEWKNYILIFTEHHKSLVYDKDDLYSYNQYTSMKVEKLTGTPYVDTCMECNKVFKTEELRYEECGIICESCYDIKSEDFGS